MASKKKDPPAPVISLPARFEVGTYVNMPKTIFADTMNQTPTHLIMQVGKETLQVRMENVLSIRPRDQKSFRAVNPHLSTGPESATFFDVLFNQRTLTAKFRAHAVEDKPNKQGFIKVTDTFGGVSFHAPSSLYREPLENGL